MLGIIHALNVNLKDVSIGKSHSATAFDNFVLEASTTNGTMFRIDPVATSKTHVGRVKIDFLGFDIKNEFVIGYGIDMNERFRNLPDIMVYEG